MGGEASYLRGGSTKRGWARVTIQAILPDITNKLKGRQGNLQQESNVILENEEKVIRSASSDTVSDAEEGETQEGLQRVTGG